MFNLYAFDGLNSAALIIPSLDIINCEFEYFLVDYESLINVETNNIVLTEGSNDNYNAGDENLDEFVQFWGVDAGAIIMITDTLFRDSKFCKGLIVYRQQQPFTVQDSLMLVNMTNYVELELLDEEQVPSLTIDGCTF